ncbi:MAG: hypothetical protein QXN36_01805 [Candidatus Bathyarchaeia archaeon]
MKLSMVTAACLAPAIICEILGFAYMRPYNYISLESTIFFSLGGFFFIAAFLAHSQVGRDSVLIEKVYVISVSLSIILLTSAVVVYTITDIKMVTEATTIHINRMYAIPGYKTEAIATPRYGSVALVLAAIGIIFLVYAFYLKIRLL